MDVAVVHPLAPSAPVCGVKDGSEAIAGMERVKFAKYADAYRESNIRFLPFVLSTFGKLGGEGDRFFQHLASGFRLAGPDSERTWSTNRLNRLNRSKSRKSGKSPKSVKSLKSLLTF